MDSESGLKKKVVFSSDDLPTELDDRRRFLLWRDLYAARYGECEMTALPDTPFAARAEFILFFEIAVTQFSLALDRHARTARQAAADARDDIFIDFNRGSFVAQRFQRNGEVVMGPGQAISWGPSR